MSKKSNIIQRVAAFSQQVVMFVGYMDGRKEENSDISLLACANEFIERYGLECEPETLRQQYYNYCEVQKMYQKSK